MAANQPLSQWSKNRLSWKEADKDRGEDKAERSKYPQEYSLGVVTAGENSDDFVSGTI